MDQKIIDLYDAYTHGALGVASSWIASRPAVLVVHENRGLNPHIRDVARRLGVEGFLAFAVDALSPLGGTPADEDKAREMIGTLDRDETLRRIAAAVPFLAAHPESNGKVGAVGFCWGGAMANRLAAAGTSLAASVAYYGMPLPAEEVPKVTAALLLHYAGLDERINAGMAAYEAALKANGRRTSSTCTRAPTTPSTTTRTRPATTRPRPTWPGAGRSPS